MALLEAVGTGTQWFYLPLFEFGGHILLPKCPWHMACAQVLLNVSNITIIWFRGNRRSRHWPGPAHWILCQHWENFLHHPGSSIIPFSTLERKQLYNPEYVLVFSPFIPTNFNYMERKPFIANQNSFHLYFKVKLIFFCHPWCFL